MRDVMLLGTRLVLGGYMAVHGSQKLFGAFGGPGLEQAGAGFERIGLTPGKPMAALAGATELGGGLLTAAGAADPAGPLAIMGAMTVASAVHRSSGPLAASRGYELPLTNLATAAALIAAGPGRLRLGLPLGRRLTAAVAAGGALLAAGSLAKMLTAARDRVGGTPPAARAESVSDAATGTASDADTKPQSARP
ncbi:MAG: DoxX family protein [Streptosporangiaceae bacterium]